MICVMVWKTKRVGGLPWRNFLTKDERQELSEIEREAEQIDTTRRDLTARRNIIVNRAIQRARYEEAEKRKKIGV